MTSAGNDLAVKSTNWRWMGDLPVQTEMEQWEPAAVFSARPMAGESLQKEIEAL